MSGAAAIAKQYPGALPPPPGVAPDLRQNDSSLEKLWMAVLIVELVPPTILYFMRVFTRIKVIKRFSLSDVTLTLGWILFVASMGMAWSLMNDGVGIPGWDLMPKEFSDYAQNLNYQNIIYMPAICLIKVAIILQFMEIFTTSHGTGRWWILLGFVIYNIVVFTIFMFLEIFVCSPRAKIWDPSIPGSCIDIQKTFIATGVINVVDDFAILILPIFWISRLQMSLKRKLSISALFAVGLFACVCSLMRLIESAIEVSNHDVTVSLVPVALWAYAELSAGIVVACLPSVPRLFSRKGPQSNISSGERSFKRVRNFFSVVDTDSETHLGRRSESSDEEQPTRGNSEDKGDWDSSMTHATLRDALEESMSRQHDHSQVMRHKEEEAQV